VSATNPLGFTRTSVYDPAGRVIANVDPLANTSTAVYDAASRRIAAINPLGIRTTSVYDLASRLLAIVDPLGNRTSLGYDAASRQVSVTDALGNTTTTVYDNDGRTLATVNPKGLVTTRVYDAIGELIAIIDARSNRVSFSYDAARRQTGTLDALGHMTTYTYDSASRQTLRIDGRGLLTSYLYDTAGRLTGQQYQNGTRATMTYDASSERTVLSDWTGLYTSTYDPDGRLSTVVNPAGLAITYSYDAASQRSTLNQPTGVFTYVYDPAGRIKTLTNPEGQVTSWSYDVASRVTAQVLANGTRVSNTYDNADRLLLLANLTSGGTTLSSFNYAYNSVGNRTQVVEVDGSLVTWAYDPTYQLTNEQRSGGTSYNITYVYDGVGSRTLMLNNGVPTTYTYDAANELVTSQTSAGVTTSAYDGSGNLLTSLAPGNQRTTNTWDGENRLIQTSLPSGVVDAFTYNGDGQRVQKQDSTGTTNHIWDGQNILLETDGSNVIKVVYTLQPAAYGNLISQSRGGSDSFYTFDAVGSTRQLASGAGSVTDIYLYDSFGNILSQNGPTTNWFRYIGRTGFYYDADCADYYARARYYDATGGRFVSCDPLAHTLQIVRIGPFRLPAAVALAVELAYDRYAPYVYAKSNPVLFTDATSYGITIHPQTPPNPVGFPPNMPPMPPWMPPIDYKPVPASCACAASQSFSGAGWDYVFQLFGLGTTSYPYQHCLWNCLMVAQCGGGQEALRCASILAWNKEVLDLVRCYLYGGAGDCESAFQPADFRDNKTGRGIGASCARNATRLCPWWQPAASWKESCCIDGCGAAVPRGTPEGPGTERPYGPLGGGGRWPSQGEL
jgi:RHS repeat-associated protein